MNVLKYQANSSLSAALKFSLVFCLDLKPLFSLQWVRDVEEQGRALFIKVLGRTESLIDCCLCENHQVCFPEGWEHVWIVAVNVTAWRWAWSCWMWPQDRSLSYCPVLLFLLTHKKKTYLNCFSCTIMRWNEEQTGSARQSLIVLIRSCGWLEIDPDWWNSSWQMSLWEPTLRWHLTPKHHPGGGQNVFSSNLHQNLFTKPSVVLV